MNSARTKALKEALGTATLVPTVVENLVAKDPGTEGPKQEATSLDEAEPEQDSLDEETTRYLALLEEAARHDVAPSVLPR